MIRSVCVFLATMFLGFLEFRLGYAIVKSLNGNIALFFESFDGVESIAALAAAGLFLAYAASRFPEK